MGYFAANGIKGPTDKEPARVIFFSKGDYIDDDNGFNLAHFCVIDRVIIQDMQCLYEEERKSHQLPSSKQAA